MNSHQHKQHTLALIGLVQQAGIEGAVAEIPNRYWPSNAGYDSVRTPWLHVTTSVGTIVLGWRKRVLSIEWEGRWTATGAEIVQQPDTTHAEHMCHAWSWDDAEKCLRKIWESRPQGPTLPRAADPMVTMMLAGKLKAAERELKHLRSVSARLTCGFLRASPTGGPASAQTLRHNAYVQGWEHAAFDHVPESSFFDEVEKAGVLGIYQKGRAAGRAARGRAWTKAARIREDSSE